MKNTKLKLEGFFSDSLNREQSMLITGGTGGTRIDNGGTEIILFPGGPTGTGGTDSGPVGPKPTPGSDAPTL
ncbi:MAG: hypothetical protein ABI426_03780 [Flavobacterium sp.]